MSLFKLILGQKLILLSIGFAILPLLAAITLTALSRFKRNAAKRARIKRTRAAAQAAARQAVVATAAQAAASAVLKQAESAPSVAVQAQIGPAQPDQSQGQPVEDTPAQTAPESPEIQNILTSVFADDEASTHYEALLADLDEVDASQLMAMCTEIAHQIRAGSTPDAQS